jgi:hypothetical protein
MKPVQNRIQYKEIPLEWNRAANQPTELSQSCSDLLLGLMRDGWECLETEGGAIRILYKPGADDGYVTLWRTFE